MISITKEQADSILKQITKLTEGKIFPVKEDELQPFTDGWHALEMNIKHILNSCVNAPPYEFMAPQAARVFNEEDYKIRLNRHVTLDTNVLYIEDVNNIFEPSNRLAIQLNNDKLKQLRDYCNKMLEWLENDRT